MSDTGHVSTGGLPPVGEQATHVPFGGDGSQPQGAVRPPYTFLDLPDGLDEEEDELLMPGPQGSWSEPVQREPVLPLQAAPMQVAVVQPVPAQAVAEQSAAQPPNQTLPLTVVPAPAAPAHASAAAPAHASAAAPAHASAEAELTPVQTVGEPIAPSWPPLTPPQPQAPQAAVQPVAQAAQPVAPEAAEPQQPQAAARRPLHAGPPIPDPSMMTGQVPVRSLAERGPSSHGDSALGSAGSAVAQHPGPEYLDHPVAEAAEAAAQAPAVVRAPSPEPLPTVPAQQASPASTLGGQHAAPVEQPQQAVAVAEPVAVPVPEARAEVRTEPQVEVQAAAQPQVTEQPSAAPVPQVEVETQAAPVAEAPVVEQPAEVYPVAAPAPTPVEAAVAEAVVAAPVEPVIPAQSTAPAGGGGRISAFMAAPSPHLAAPVPPQAPAAEAPVEQPGPAAEPVPVPVPVPEPVADALPQPDPAADVTALGSGLLTGAVPAPDDAAEPVAAAEPPAQAEVEAQPAPEALAPEAGTPAPATAPVPATDPAADAAPQAEAAPEPVAEEPVVAADPAFDGPAAPAYEDEMREAVHRVMRERRDIRNGFRPDPVPHDVLLRVLEAAHTAPSVGYSQPWDFVVIRSAKTRTRMHELAERQRDAYAESLPKGRAKQFKELKIEAILETPVNIVVTADRTRGGRHTLGRHTQPQMAPYSAALAVENLWLAARAEGLGVGWVSFFDEQELVTELGLPEHLEVVAYLCVGYVNEFPSEPELAQAGWAKKRPLSWVVHEETYGRRALPGEEPHSVLQETLRGIRPLDAKALGEAWDRQKRMTKPAGSLGMLEIISAQLCGLSRKCPPPIPEPACVAVFAGDHGVHAQGVTHWPQEVTAQMVANFLAGGAVVNAFANQLGAEVCVIDVGVAAELPAAIESGRTTGLLPRKVRAGTADMTTGPAMTREEALQAIEVGIETARDLVAAGNKALVTGDMGIANTTAAAALICVFTGEDPSVITGRGTGINDETHARKVAVIRQALELHRPDPADPIGVLAAVGGLEHAAIAGFLLGAASLRTPVILDGVIAGAAGLVAKAIAPEVLAACIAGHRSAEPGHKAALAKLGLRPLIDLDLRLGEGTGALLALPLVQSAARAMHDVATFDSAGVTDKH
ncbi:nicotinate-nucleotide--dimethylbenzimidazole phosphoribosyltransferase [Streptacidiphilus sp. P02-A3a]|uniref:nicotinate-nucleotide--dimethylbenzimidazole phosphoribosyltransferase n=1 Tax=Streptacidiphilus sp. P02-A3a TaxID=2704468 RepID=UPI0015F8226B|nr:nicotinate-nucleotide--dimethylbenzimidazole phosphoribosyltransferase [Streptacidiphilus sp. P02-A3a]QMU69183.1 nicotinate-nucleotide--dimethylbenzimidazole phosphoribosyltransferase [Streptacidiphilus sp. P02-A3a]